MKYDKRKIDMDELFTLVCQGKTDSDIARHFGVPPATWYQWKKARDEWAYKVADIYDRAVDHAEQMLFQKAVGFEEVSEEYAMDQSGELILTEGGDPIIKRRVRKHPPDNSALQFLLKNRRPDRWKDKVDVAATVDVKDERTMEEAARMIAFTLNKAQYAEIADHKQLSNEGEGHGVLPEPSGASSGADPDG